MMDPLNAEATGNGTVETLGGGVGERARNAAYQPDTNAIPLPIAKDIMINASKDIMINASDGFDPDTRFVATVNRVAMPTNTSRLRNVERNVQAVAKLIISTKTE